MAAAKLMPKIFITGASGLAGSIIVSESARQNISVRVLVRRREKVQWLEGFKNVEVVEGDLLKPESYIRSLHGIEKALLISAAFERLTDTQQTFINVAKIAGVNHVIKFSGFESGIGFNPQNFDAMAEHFALEDYLVHSGLQWSIVRPSQFMQMYLPGAPTGVNPERSALIVPYGVGKLTPVDVEDVAKVCLQLLTGNGHYEKVYQITGPDAMDMNEACEIMSRVLQRGIKYIDPGISDYIKLYLPPDIHPDRVRIVRQISLERRKCTESLVYLDTHHKFGIRPTNFAEFIYKNASAFTGLNRSGMGGVQL